MKNFKWLCLSQSSVVTRSTTCFNINKLHALPTWMILTKTATISLNTIDWLVFVMEMQRVCCELGINFLNIILVNFMLWRVNSYVHHMQYTEGHTLNQWSADSTAGDGVGRQEQYYAICCLQQEWKHFLYRSFGTGVSGTKWHPNHYSDPMYSTCSVLNILFASLQTILNSKKMSNTFG
jgi:hypothetical protein